MPISSECQIAVTETRKHGPRVPEVRSAYDRLEEKIVMLELAPGACRRDSDLAGQFELDPVPLRAALRHLAAEGMVTYAAGEVKVSAIDTDRQLNLLQMRRRVEVLTAGLAATRATSLQRSRFRALDASFRQVRSHGDEYVFLRLDRAFNELLLEAADNPYCTMLMQAVSGLARRYFYINRRALDTARTAELHARIAAAVAAADTRRAEAAVGALLDHNIRYAIRKSRDDRSRFIRQTRAALPVRGGDRQP